MNIDPLVQREPGASAAVTRSESVLVHPRTGEMLNVADATTTTLADWRLEATELKRELDSMSRVLDDELIARLDHESTRSARVGDFNIKTTAPSADSYDVDRLGIILEALVDDGRISPAVASRCIRIKRVYEPAIRELNKLLAHADPEVRRAIEGVRDVSPRARRVSVSRARD